MSDNSGWCTIESDPGVFTELIQNIGVSGVQVEEVITLEDFEMYKDFDPIYGLIFLFKYIPEHKTQREIVEREDIWFAKQVINNACATQAILSVLFNNNSVDLGGLFELKFDTMSFDSETKGISIGNSDVIRQVHNSFSRPEPFQLPSAPAKSGDDVYHFVSYIPFEGRLFELDGLQNGPIDHGEISSDNWLNEASEAIKKRIAMYNDELGFTILAVVRNLKEKFEEEHSAKTTENQEILSKLAGNVDDAARESLEAQSRQLEEDISILESKIQNEISKFSDWKEENTRRRHNYIPFIFNFLSALGKKNQLLPLYNKAQDKSSE